MLTHSRNRTLLKPFNPFPANTATQTHTPNSTPLHSTRALSYSYGSDSTIFLRHREMKNGGNALGGCYLSKSLAVSFASLLSNEHQLLVFLLPLMNFIETGQQAHQQHESDQTQQGEDGYSQGRQLIGWGKKTKTSTEKNNKSSVTAGILSDWLYCVAFHLSSQCLVKTESCFN